MVSPASLSPSCATAGEASKAAVSGSSDSAIVQAANGDILFNAYQQDMQVLRAVFRAAFATATAVTEREQGATGDAYPFAVLTS